MIKNLISKGMTTVVGIVVIVLDLLVLLASTLQQLFSSIPYAGKVLSFPFTVLTVIGKIPAILLTVGFVLFLLFKMIKKMKTSSKRNAEIAANPPISKPQSTQSEESSNTKKATSFQ